jgi:hypothetical protein
MPRNPVGQRQFTTGLIGVLEVDGSEVTTTSAVTGLVKGQYLATVKKGSSADSNLVTITFNKPFGLVPSFLFQPKTLDCECREEGTSTKTVVTIRTLKSTNLATQVNDADFSIFVFGTEDIREGFY